MRKKNSEKFSERYVTDTGVLVESIIENSPYRGPVARLLDNALRKIIELYVTPLTISELLYVASKVYEAAAVKDCNAEALNFLEWLLARAKTTEVTPEISFKAGEIRKMLKIALPDCYVIAAAIKLQAKALFLKPEKEMLMKLEDLKKFPIIFLTEAKVS